MRGTEVPADSVVDIGQIATRVAALPHTMTCGEVERLFTRNVGQSSLVVTDAAGAPMLVDRTAFLDTMVGRNGYGRPLYHQEPIAAVLDRAATC